MKLPKRNDDRKPVRALALLGVAVAAAAGYVAVASAVTRRPRKPERQVRKTIQREVRRHGGPRLKRAAKAISPLGAEKLHAPLMLGVGYAIRRLTRPHSRTAQIAVTLASSGAAALTKGLEELAPRRQPPPGHPDPDDQSFPSGHALETTAIALTTAYVLARETDGRATAVLLPVAALVPLLAGVGKLVQDRHWPSDLAGGYLAGTAYAALCAAAYEVAPEL